MIKVAPSLLSADFSCLGQEIKRAEAAGADLLHIDVMDGHFVPNITIGPVVIKRIRRITMLPLDVHLMIERPQALIDGFIDTGCDMITVHIETVSVDLIRKLKNKLRSKGVKLGISLNPSTPLTKMLKALQFADFILVMSVHPGFAGQEFIPGVIPKIRRLRAVFPGDISVDGGINDATARRVISAGANILAAGSYLFGAKNMKLAIERIRNAGK